MIAPELQALLKLHKHVVPTKTSTPVLRHVLLLPDKIVSTDLDWRLETACKLPGIPEEGLLIEFSELLRAAEFSEGKLTFGLPKDRPEANYIGLCGEDSTVNLYKHHPKDYDFPNAPKIKGMTFFTGELLKAFCAVEKFADPTADWEPMRYVEIKNGFAVGMNGTYFKTVKTNAPDVLLPSDKPALIRAFKPESVNPSGLLVSPLGKLYFKPLDREFPAWKSNSEKGDYLGKLVLDKKILARIENLRRLENKRDARVKFIVNGGFRLETSAVSLDLAGEANIEFSARLTFSLLKNILNDIGEKEVKLFRCASREQVTIFETDEALYGLAKRNDKE